MPPSEMKDTSTDVFFLTSEWEDSPSGHRLRFYGRSGDLGPVEILITSSPPLFFVERGTEGETGLWLRRKELDMKTFRGASVDALYFSGQRDLLNAAQFFERKNIPTYESDIHPCQRFLMERFICGQARVSGPMESRGRLGRFTDPLLKPAQITPGLRVLSFDIETGVRSGELLSIALHFWGQGPESTQVLMAGPKPDAAKTGPIEWFSEGRELLKRFLALVESEDPDIVIGWNVVAFDLTFLEAKAARLGVPFCLGRGARTARVRQGRNGGFFAHVPGRVVLDGPVLLRGSFYSFEDYSLESVSRSLLGEGKAISKIHDRGMEIERMFREDKEALARYNLQDARLVSRIFQKTGLIELAVKRVQISGLLFDQLGASTAAFDHFYLPRLHRKGYVAPNVKDIRLLEHAAGGYVMEPKAGLYDHVLLLDFKSLYPSIIRTFGIDPLSRLLADQNSPRTPHGFKFSAADALLPEFIKELLEKRAQAKKQNDAHLSQAIKILMNSFYGVMGSAGCRFYHPDLPSAITSTGQWILLESKKFLEGQDFEVLYGDTDSLFLKFTPAKNTSPAQLGQSLTVQLNSHLAKVLLEDFRAVSCLESEYEKYYRKFFLPPSRSGQGGAKKRYAGLSVSDASGEEKLEFVGMEFVRSDWTRLAKEFQEGLYLRLFREEALEDWILTTVQDVRSGRLDPKLVYRKRLRKEAGEYVKAMPPHVKAARMLENPGREVRYLMTPSGPVPEELSPSKIDYEHYIEKQLAPIADTVLGILGKSFRQILQTQGDLPLYPKT